MAHLVTQAPKNPFKSASRLQISVPNLPNHYRALSSLGNSFYIVNPSITHQILSVGMAPTKMSVQPDNTTILSY